MARGHIRSRPPTPNGEERWQLVIDIGRDDTGRRRQTYKTVIGARETAEVELARLIVQRGDGKLTATDLTLGQLAGRWLDWHGANLSPSTLDRYRGVVRRLAASDLGQRPIRTLRTVDLDLRYAELRDRGLAPASVRQIHAVVRQALRQAVRWDLVPVNVAADATIPTKPRGQVQAPSPETVRQLIDAAVVDGDLDLAILIRFAATTGARRGELCGLRWRDVDLTTGAVHIRSNVVHAPDEHGRRGVLVKAPKSHQPRRLTLDSGTLAALVDHRSRCDARAAACRQSISDDGFVFSLAATGRDIPQPDSMTQRFVNHRNRHGIDGVRLHDLRHFAASQMVAGGVPITTVAGRLGHRNPAVTLGVYSHFVEETDVEAAELLGGLLT